MKRLALLLALTYALLACPTTQPVPEPHKLGALVPQRAGDFFVSPTATTKLSIGSYAVPLGQVVNVGPARPTQMDFDSIVTGDLSAPEWINSSALVFSSPVHASDGTFTDLVQINANGSAGASGSMRQAFSPPTGTTSVTFSVSCLEASSKAYRLTIFASDGSTDLGHTDCTTNAATLTACSVTVASMTPGSLYWASLLPDVSAQEAAPQCGRAQIKPVNGTGLFAGDFVRIRASLELLAGSYGKEARFGGGTSYPFSNPQSDMTIVTSSSRVAAELLTFSAADMAWLVGGRPYEQVGSLGGSNTFAYSDIAVPTSSSSLSPGPQRITARDSEGTLGGDVGYLVAMYASLPCSYLTVEHPAKQPKRAVIYGDSIEGGFYATNNLLQGWQALFKLKYPGIVTLEQYSGRSFYTDTNNGTTANEQSFAFTLAKSNATDVILAIGTNDYGNAQWTAAAFGTAYAAVLDDLHGYLPNADVWCISPIHRSTETANALGNTLTDFRTQINTACTSAARSPWIHFIDGFGSNMPQVANLQDGVHPNTEGHAMYARTVENAMGLGGFNISGARPVGLAGLILASALIALRRRRPANDTDKEGGDIAA